MYLHKHMCRHKVTMLTGENVYNGPEMFGGDGKNILEDQCRTRPACTPIPGTIFANV